MPSQIHYATKAVEYIKKLDHLESCEYIKNPLTTPCTCGFEYAKTFVQKYLEENAVDVT